ncbi:hypothetical protein Cgig2_017890 [Carnegiea gigantea]|uniref:SAC domain-containing protein n=1 Tax=Carnegiea gigantea TaxID=171969 RepID=A0A9Q1GYN0_9CARY|nr:hypothetical protein Cgig2_017890 [Carnegiea gigantea]
MNVLPHFNCCIYSVRVKILEPVLSTSCLGFQLLSTWEESKENERFLRDPFTSFHIIRNWYSLNRKHEYFITKVTVSLKRWARLQFIHVHWRQWILVSLVCDDISLGEKIKLTKCYRNFETRNSPSTKDPQTGCGDEDNIERGCCDNEPNGDFAAKRPMFQKGVLRTNCIDCLDRTNVAQFSYGLAALGHQLHALEMINIPKIDLDSPLADDLMGLYEKMGDTLAHQYGGSAAHNKIFSQRRGQWKAATQSQEFFRTLQRYYSNAYMDAEKQNAINVFLGHFQPQHGKPALWELGSDQHCDARRKGRTQFDENGRCWSDGNILHESDFSVSTTRTERDTFPKLVFPDRSGGDNGDKPESSHHRSTTESDASYRYSPSVPRKHLVGNVQREQYVEKDNINIYERADSLDCSNFLDLDWLSSSGYSCEEESYERSLSTSSPIGGFFSDNVMNEVTGDSTPTSSQYCSSMKGQDEIESESPYVNVDSLLEDFSDSFVHWVAYGETLCH